MAAVRWLAPEWHASLGSTSTHLLADPRPGRVVVADHQSAGLGRRGRGWTAPPGTALAVSAAVPAPSPDVLGWVPLVAGLAVVRTLTGGPYAVRARLKWPNDVLLQDPDGQARKGCGILAQMAEHPVAGRVVVVGTGLNVDQGRAELPVPTATSWRLARGGDVLPVGAREAFVTAYLKALAAGLDQLARHPDTVREDYRATCDTLGRLVDVHLPDGSTSSGTAVDVSADGALEVHVTGGRRTHHAGDVVHVRPR